MTVVGIDLSLHSTGVAGHEGPKVLRTPPQLRGVERLVWVTRKLREELLYPVPDLVVMEGYAYARENQAHQAGELGGVVRVMIWRSKLPLMIVAPASLKKFATKVGNAKKEMVLAEAIRRLGYAGSSFDEADALFLQRMGRGFLHEVDLLAYERAEVNKLTWPIAEPEVIHA